MSSPPPFLTDRLEWFGRLIGRPLTEEGKIQPLSPQNHLIAEEAKEYLLPSPTLQPHERLEIYNQQYWYRLLTVLQEEFPLLLRLFGYHAFNQEIATPYLLEYPPSSWSLNPIGEKFVEWIDAKWKGKEDHAITYAAAQVDWAYHLAFHAPNQHPTLLEARVGAEELLHLPLTLQPHLQLLTLSHHLLSIRKKFLEKEVDEWMELPFPQVDHSKEHQVALFRDEEGLLHWTELSPEEHNFLSLFQEPKSLAAASQVAEERGGSLHRAASQKLSTWVQDWAQLNWLSLLI